MVGGPQVLGASQPLLADVAQGPLHHNVIGQLGGELHRDRRLVEGLTQRGPLRGRHVRKELLGQLTEGRHVAALHLLHAKVSHLGKGLGHLALHEGLLHASGELGPVKGVGEGLLHLGRGGLRQVHELFPLCYAVDRGWGGRRNGGAWHGKPLRLHGLLNLFQFRLMDKAHAVVERIGKGRQELGMLLL